MPKPVAITLLSKPGCHLCDDARAVVRGVLADFERRGAPVSFDEIDILGDPKLARLHAEEIPVVLVNGRRHAIWRVDPDRLTAAIEKRGRAFAR
ncbi:MAG: glutaredoxin family protein [Candidatus Leucobacter sulfamidivorax]|nr:glutaredoxin family protein [Candidatus Leucobacter sulfamidivorax]